MLISRIFTYIQPFEGLLHLWRVWRSQSAHTVMNGLSVAIIFVMTLLLSIILWQWLGQKFVASTDASHAVRWLVVVLTALTLPHLVLVSLSSRLLSAREPDK